jgi:hypothetical protein
MYADVRVTGAALHSYLRSGCCEDREFRRRRVHPRRCAANECVGNHVLSRVAAFETSRCVASTARRRVVLMSRKAVMVFGMIVIDVGVRVQQRHDPERRNQRGDEQQRQDAVHGSQSMREHNGGQKPGTAHRLRNEPLGGKLVARIRRFSTETRPLVTGLCAKGSAFRPFSLTFVTATDIFPPL